ncbi:hypothetical protein DFA_06036 [Cavenderia fasciculata]|uniref:WD40 repeat-containing protein n=1 Tax=Cavenderia fasciculata TaxID=261658 RepID=F4PJX4_CACFS|nr:uncharacterized protein DFA_06036 [Cavenderia fasciculata]EGG23898.1 hypothetical protein DFA_06036 [Cavenderia fasciculata]|eukprot:XP_004361749.1 hypothetical protein DFA_06036 [Cavenderia fasciculata]
MNIESSSSSDITSNTPLNISTASTNNNNNSGGGLDESSSNLSEREVYLKALISSAEYSGPPKRSIYLEDDPSIFDEDDPQLKEDIIRMIIQATLSRWTDEEDEKGNLGRRLDRGGEVVSKVDVQEPTIVLVRRLQAGVSRVARETRVSKGVYLPHQASQAARGPPKQRRRVQRPLLPAHVGSHLASATGDGIVRIYDIATPEKPAHLSTIAAHEGDAYTVQFHPGGNHIVTGGYDKSLHLYDVRTGQLVKSLIGHSSSVTRAIFNPHGNLVITGSKDCTIKFWDLVSGVCIKTLSSHLGEVTSVSTTTSGTYLLSASKDNSNRLWDIRTARPVKRFKGHQNTSKNFIRSAFGPNESLVIGGSEDGSVYIWDIETCNILQKLNGHQGMVYSVQWSQQQSVLASSSHDNTVKLWWYDPSFPILSSEE